MNSKQVMVDTSAWVQALRVDGDGNMRRRVEALLQSGVAVWCKPVRLELSAGVRDHERFKMRRLQARVPRMPITSDVWDRACDLASRARQSGLTVPRQRSADLCVRGSKSGHN